jgi:hypothetical protein
MRFFFLNGPEFRDICGSFNSPLHTHPHILFNSQRGKCHQGNKNADFIKRVHFSRKGKN